MLQSILTLSEEDIALALLNPLLTSRYHRNPANSKAKKIKVKKWICERVVEANEQTCYRGFARKADLQRHMACVHDKAKQTRKDCPHRRCSRKGENGFLRQDHLTEHLRHFHNQAIPKRARRNSHMNTEEPEDEIDDVQTEQGGQQQYFN
jgi:hypothetical protein